MRRFDIDAVKIILPFSSGELTRLREYFDSASNPRDSALFELLVGYGLRVSEVTRVRRAGTGNGVGFAPIKQTPSPPISYDMHGEGITRWIKIANVPFGGLLFTDDLDKMKAMSIAKIQRIVEAWLVIAGCSTQEGQGVTFFRRKMYASTAAR